MTNNVKRFGKVAVLLGGTSAEREVSLNSGKAVLDALTSKGVDAHAVDVGEDIVQVLQQGQFDCVFNVLHGPNGEDGRMQALLEFLKIPYCGSGVAACSLAMDKIRAKWVWQANGIPTPKFLSLKSEADLKQVEETLGLPICIKPVDEGSSVGVTKVKSYDQLLPAYREARQYNENVMAEEWIEGGEYTVGIVAGKSLPSVKVSTPNREFYDYEAKYIDHSTVYECPNDLSEAKEKELQNLALKAFSALDCKAWGRVDFMQDAQGDFWAIELNPHPGMTSTSLLPKSAKSLGLEFPDLVLSILETLDMPVHNG